MQRWQKQHTETEVAIKNTFNMLKDLKETKNTIEK